MEHQEVIQVHVQVFIFILLILIYILNNEFISNIIVHHLIIGYALLLNIANQKLMH